MDFFHQILKDVYVNTRIITQPMISQHEGINQHVIIRMPLEENVKL